MSTNAPIRADRAVAVSKSIELFKVCCIIRPMRRYFLLALILLTSLRGLAGDAMAMEMSGMHHSSSMSVQHSLADKSTTHEHHCVAGDVLGADLTQSSSDGSHSSNCMSCQVCNTPAMQISAAFVPTLAVSSEHGDRRVFSWMSADLVQPQKPPVL